MDRLGICLLSGLSYGMVLFLLSAGLSVVLGLMGIIQLAHAAIVMFGGYVGVTVAKATDNFLLGILAGGTAAGMIGFVLERGFLRYLYQRHREQIMVTFGFVFILTNIVVWIWGPWPKSGFVPSLLGGSILIGTRNFPVHRILVIAIGAGIFFALWWLQEKTRIGAIVRAGMDDAEMVSGLGINLGPLTVGVFFLGSFLAGFAAVVGAPLLGGVSPDQGFTLLLLAMAVCIVGGVGSIQGALAGALLIGIIYTLVATYLSVLAMFTAYLIMIIILIFRPSGLRGRKL
jgi:branched-chain amino acid transport system permease protein